MRLKLLRALDLRVSQLAGRGRTMNPTQQRPVDASQIDYELLRDGIGKANVPSLIMCLVQMTGNERWMKPPYTPQRGRGLDDNDDAGLSEELQDEIRDAAYDACVAWLKGAPMVRPRPSNVELASMLEVAMCENVPSEYGDIVAAGMGLDDDQPPAKPQVGKTAIVIGGGISGMCAAIELQKLGIPYTLFEKNTEFGGTWWENCYPGCGVDTPSLTYTFSFRPNDWTKYFPLRDEIEGYLLETAREYGLYEHAQFETHVTAAKWNDVTSKWQVTVSGPDGKSVTHEADFVFSAVGLLNTPKFPKIPGMENFTGRVVHTCQWPDDLDLAGKRVAVVGNGASAMQVVPAIADEVEQLTIFARSKQWAAPFPQFRKEIPEGVRYLMQVVPLYRHWFEQRLSWTFNDRVLGTLYRDPEWHDPARAVNAVNDGHRQFFTRYVEQELEGHEDLIPKVLPDFPPFAKRMLLDNGWYRSIRKPNVRLVDERLSGIEGSTLTASNGETADVDVLILATGYETTQVLGSYEITGRDGRDLHEFWGEDDAAAFLGTLVPGFPNFFILLGPNVGSGHGGSMIRNIENQAHYASEIVHQTLQNGAHTVEVKDAVYQDYMRQIDEAHDKLVWTHPGTENWYRNPKGRVIAITPWRNDAFWRMTRKADPAHLEFETIKEAQPS